MDVLRTHLVNITPPDLQKLAAEELRFGSYLVKLATAATIDETTGTCYHLSWHEATEAREYKGPSLNWMRKEQSVKSQGFTACLRWMMQNRSDM